MRGGDAPVLLVTGIAEEPMELTTISLQWDLPRAVVLRHRIDVAGQQLHRTVSDVTGVLDRTVVDLQHACVSCAIREDIIPTLRQLTTDGRWDAVIAHLPVGAEASQVCRVTAYEGDRGGLRVAGVVAALEAAEVVDDLLGEDLLCERGLHSSEQDERGVGEAGAAVIEYADVVTFTGGLTVQGRDLVAALARPGAALVDDCTGLDGPALLAGARRHEDAEAWVAEVRRASLPTPDRGQVWTLDLRSPLPLHPGRLHAAIEDIGGGPRRSRGCFWLPGRPSEICGWNGAGGQLSIGSVGSWGLTRPLTRITVTGLDDGADEIRTAFHRCLLTQAETDHRGTFWEMSTDGFEPWLGPIHRAA
jgi:G3E family GTPase